MPVDRGGGVGRGEADPLRVGEDGVERRALAGHAGEDVVAGAVEDAQDGLDVVTDQAFAKRLDARDATADAGFKTDVAAVFTGDAEQLFTVGG